MPHRLPHTKSLNIRVTTSILLGVTFLDRRSVLFQFDVLDTDFFHVVYKFNDIHGYAFQLPCQELDLSVYCDQ